ncbi:hypothetical protein [Campylobacter concisus]|uniref:ATP-dependent protease n=1 Tax=Campylobacter concisus (strain 13826) TaxID=360104 RepID=A7ZFW7_CAMC1|nr:hypothetical protein [Campylobacter concisus]EAT98121.1 hypothetical protein CCC13826_1730 [Campylobacter concisus 13826]
MKFLLCLSLSLIALFAEERGCFVDENSQNIIFVKDGETKRLGLKEKIYKDQRCAFDESSFYVANLNNQIVKVASQKEFFFALPNVGCKVSNILLEKEKIYVACDMANVVTIAIFDKGPKKFISKNFNNVYKISSFLPLGEGAFFTSFNGKAFLLDSKLNAKEQKSVGFAPISACKFSDNEIFIGFRNGEILDLKSGAKKQVLRSKISALACVGDEVLVASEDGVIYKFDKSFKLKSKKELFSGEIKEIFIDKNVLVGVDLGNKTKSLEINSF